MKTKRNRNWAKLTLMGVVIFILGCGLFQNPGTNTSPTQTATPTFIPAGGNAPVTPTMANRCEGLSGSLEMQMLAGPAAAVGMEPYAIGDIPFSVTADGAIQGGGTISYQQVLEEGWGTYTVTLDLTIIVSGECSGSTENETLNMTVEMSGEQMVEVRAEGFSGDYPWSGTHQLDLALPIKEGVSAESEGWAFILHLNK